MLTFQDILAKNIELKKWFNMLKEIDKNQLIPIIDQILLSVQKYNELFSGFELYITGSSLNLTNRSYNDIDFMAVIPVDTVRNIKLKILKELHQGFKNQDHNKIEEIVSNQIIRILCLMDLSNSVKESLIYLQEIYTKNYDAILGRLGSKTEVNRIRIDPDSELTAIKERVEGLIVAEKSRPMVEIDGSHGYQFGSIVEEFLKNLEAGLNQLKLDGQLAIYLQWHKSFNEGYGKLAGENNFYVYSGEQCTPVHVFLTTGIDFKKSMVKKESFMIEYYSPQERSKPIKML